MLHKLSRSFTALCLLLFMALILVIPDICIAGASSGLLLWFHKLLPSLLPFIILINMLCHLGVIFKLSGFIEPISQLLFKISGTSFLIFALGLIAGYPMGAKLTKQLLDTNQITASEAQKTLCFATNCGPLFIIGTVGSLILHNVSLGYFLAIIHILSSVIMLILSRFYRPTITSCKNHYTAPTLKSTSFSEAFSQSVQNGMDTIVYVGGYIIFFSMIINILKHSNFFDQVILCLSKLLPIHPDTLYQILLGSLEFSNGSALISSMQPFSLHHLALLCALITFGGFCVFFQCTYVLSGSPLKLNVYLISKLFQAGIAYSLTFICYPLVMDLNNVAILPFIFVFSILCFLAILTFKLLK